MTHPDNARSAESAMLDRCSLVARDDGKGNAKENEITTSALDQREANVFRLAAMVVQSRFPGESLRLMQASDRYFSSHPNDMLAVAEVVRKGWVLSLPRLRDMLSHRLFSQ